MTSLSIKTIDCDDADFDAAVLALARSDAAERPEVREAAMEICADVMRRGDAAILEYTARFDGLDAQSAEELELPQARLKAAWDGLAGDDQAALQAAHDRIFLQVQQISAFVGRELEKLERGDRMSRATLSTAKKTVTLQYDRLDKLEEQLTSGVALRKSCALLREDLVSTEEALDQILAKLPAQRERATKSARAKELEELRKMVEEQEAAAEQVQRTVEFGLVRSGSPRNGRFMVSMLHSSPITCS